MHSTLATACKCVQSKSIPKLVPVRCQRVHTQLPLGAGRTRLRMPLDSEVPARQNDAQPLIRAIDPYISPEITQLLDKEVQHLPGSHHWRLNKPERKDSDWRRQQGKHRIRFHLTQKIQQLHREDYDEAAHGSTLVRRHVMVRELETTLLSLSKIADMQPDNCPDSFSRYNSRAGAQLDGASEILAKALAQYKKIRVSSNSQQLIPQIRPTYAILLITELNFSRSSLYYSSRFDLIIQIYDDFARMGSPITDTLAFSLYLRALNERGMHRQALTAIENYNKLPGTTTKDVLSAAVIRQLLAAYFGAGRPDKAVELFDMLRTSDAHRVQLTPHTYTKVIEGGLQSGYLNNGELLALVDELLDLLITSKTPTEQHIGVLNQLLQIAGLSSNYDFLFAVLEKFLARKVAISYTTFAILLKVHAQIQPDVSHMLNLYRLITSHNQAQSMMTTPVFSAFIDYFVRANKLAHAESVLEDLRQHPIAQPNMRTVGLLMARYGKAGLMDRALSLYHRIVDEDKIAPDWSTYMLLAEAIYRSAYPLDRVSPSLERFKQFDSLLVDIIHQGRANNYSGMFSAFSELRSLAPTSMMPLVAVLFQSSNIARKRVRAIQNGPMAITRLGAGFPTDAEFELFTANFRTCVDDLLSSSENGLPVKQFLFNMAISISAQIRDYDTTQRVYDYLTKTEGMEPTAQTFRALIRSYISSFDYASATDVLDELATRNVPLSCITFNALIHGFIAAGLPEQAIKAYSFMVGRPVALLEAPEFKDFLPVTRPDIYTFATMADGLVSAGMFKEAIVVFEDSFTLLSYVPRQLLETLVSSLEEKMQFDLSQICLKRFGRRIEESQPAEVQVATSDGKQIAMAETPADKLPLSYFGYLLQRSRRM